jgi:hypothetical protein
MKRAPKYLPEDVQKLSSKELAEHLFPKRALEKIKKDLEVKPKPKAPKK